MADPVRWAVIGASGFAARSALPALAEAERSVPVSVLSSDPKRAEDTRRQLGLPRSATDLADLLADDEVEAVWITSPNHLHHAQGMAALAAGKHVLLEKPLATSAADSWELVEVARTAGLVLATGYQARYVPGHQRMQELVADGAIGDVTLARTVYGYDCGGSPVPWRRDRATAAWGALGDLGTHHLDLMRMIVGEVDTVTGIGRSQLGFDTEDALTASVAFTSGAVGSLSVTRRSWRDICRVEIYGTEGEVQAVDTSPDGSGPVTLTRGDGAPEDLAEDRPSAFVAQVETVSAVVRGAAVAYATGADGARNVELLEQLLPVHG